MDAGLGLPFSAHVEIDEREKEFVDGFVSRTIRDGAVKISGIDAPPGEVIAINREDL
jgi:hypothetical protein